MELDRLWRILDQGGEIITFSADQARYLKKAWLLRHQHDIGTAPAIRALSVVLESSFYAQPHRRRLMSAASVKRLWQRIISDDSPEAADAKALARLAVQADRLMFEYHIEPPTERETLSVDERSFLRWRARFEQEIEQFGWVDRNRVFGALAGQPLRVKALVGWYGFDEKTPFEQAIWNQLDAQGVAQETLPRVVRNGTARYYRAQTDDQEWLGAVHWLREALARNPKGRYVILDESLGEHRANRERLVGRYLLGTVPSAVDWLGAPVRFVDGQPLSDSMVVADALAVLQLLKPRIRREDLSRVFKSKYLKFDAQQSQDLLALEMNLWSVPVLELSADHWRRWFQKQLPLSESFLRLLSTLTRLNLHAKTADASVWATDFLDVWRTVGWPKGSALSDVEYDAAKALQSQLEEFAQSAPWMGQLSLSQAIVELQQLVGENTIDTGTTDAPVHIVGQWTDIGVPVDGLWVMGLRAESFPKSPRALPFIRPRWKNASLCPGVNANAAKREADQWRAVWGVSASEVVYSTSLSDGRSMYTEPSDFCTLPPLNPVIEPIPSLELLEKVHVHESRLMPIESGTVIRGGIRVIDHQASCPFKAAVDYRLKPKQWRMPEYGINAMLRGIWMHEALKEIWGQLKDQAGLNALDEPALEQLVEHWVNQKTPAELEGFELDPLVKVEAERLTHLVLGLLRYEKSRDAFEVLATEKSISDVHLGGLNFQFQIDRIDRMVADADGVVLIDYKSGEHQAPQWDQSPPTPIQLPVYASVWGSAVTGLALVYPNVLNTKKKPYAGAGRIGVEGTKPLDTLLPLFKPEIERLVASFRAGEAIATPSKAACDYCAYELLCRVRYEALVETEEPAGDDGDD